MILRENDSSIKKQQWIRRRVPLIQIKDENNVVTESFAGDGFLATQSAKKQHVSKSNTNYKKAHLRRSCAPRFINTESVSRRATSATPYGGYGSEKTSTLFSSVTHSSRNQGDSGDDAPEKPVGSDFSSRFVSGIERRRRSRLLRQEEDLETERKNNKNEDGSESIDRYENEHERICEDGEKKSCLVSSHLTRARMKMVSKLFTFGHLYCTSLKSSEFSFISSLSRIINKRQHVRTRVRANHASSMQTEEAD